MELALGLYVVLVVVFVYLYFKTKHDNYGEADETVTAILFGCLLLPFIIPALPFIVLYNVLRWVGKGM